MTTTLTVRGNGTVNYDGGFGDLDIIDFNSASSASLTLGIADYQLRENPKGVLIFELRGGDGADRLLLQQSYDALIDLSKVTFSGGWNPARDGITINDTAFSNRMIGSGGTDRFVLTGGFDSVTGGAGQDTLALNYAFQSVAFTTNGPGQIRSGGEDGPRVDFAGIERIDARLGSGADSLQGLAGRDILRGGDGDDRLFGLGEADSLLGQVGNDALYGGAGRDTALGGQGDDDLFGGSSRDELYGGSGNDQLLGGADRDLLLGNAGEDLLRGGAARDELRLGGDAAADSAFFAGVAESTGLGRDIVRGFDADEDVFAFQLTPAETDNFDALAVSTRSGGRLASATFNADIAAALNPFFTANGATQAVLWNPTSGNLDEVGHRYLVIDWDNDGSYQAGKDYVIELADMTGSLAVADFVFTALG